jgi:hypothetical protein
MINIKKIDDHDLVFVNKPFNEKEEQEFSKFLQTRKAKSPVMKKRKLTARKKALT